MDLNRFSYPMDDVIVAERPISPRDKSRMLCLPSDGNLYNSYILDLPNRLLPGDVIVLNDVRVIKSFLTGICNSKKITFNLLKSLNQTNDLWEILAKPLKHLHPGDKIILAGENSFAICEDVTSNFAKIRFHIPEKDIFFYLDKYASMPIPPYIRKGQADDSDVINYQTVFAGNTSGAVAAPTAGLHFSNELILSLKQKGVKFTFVTLHVGGGTFLPIRSNNILDHKMHSEFCSINEDSLNIIKEAKKNSKRIVAIGTTVARTLETIGSDLDNITSFSGDTSLYITPGYKFKIVNILVTNFHFPKSTLLILVAAFCGYNNMKRLYEHAIDNKYRFFSYGDACMLYNQPDRNS